jgi:valyl-tRNA synthetase
MIRTVLFIVILALATTASAQTRPAAPARETDAIAALTAELRALRAELAETARASLRLQLLTARIQAQEQRIIYLDRQRADAANRRLQHEQGLEAMRNQTRVFSPAELTKLSDDDRRGLEMAMSQQKRELARQEQTLSELRTQETDAENALSQEQARWGELNNRLEELERTLR